MALTLTRFFHPVFARALLAMLLGGACAWVSAQSARPALSALALVGTWTSTAPFGNGASMKTQVTLTQNQRFGGGATVDGKPVWTFSGRWEVRSDGPTDVLTWYYERSAPQLRAGSEIDRDDVVAIDGEKMVLRSRMNRKENVFTRVR